MTSAKIRSRAEVRPLKAGSQKLRAALLQFDLRYSDAVVIQIAGHSSFDVLQLGETLNEFFGLLIAFGIELDDFFIVGEHAIAALTACRPLPTTPAVVSAEPAPCAIFHNTQHV